MPKVIATFGFLALLAVTKKSKSLKAPALRKKANQPYYHRKAEKKS